MKINGESSTDGRFPFFFFSHFVVKIDAFSGLENPLVPGDGMTLIITAYMRKLPQRRRTVLQVVKAVSVV